MIGLMCLKELVLIKPLAFLSVLFVITCTYLLKVTFSFQSKACNDWHNLMQKAMSLLDVAIASVKGNFYRIHFWYMSKEKSINKIKNSDLK